MSSLNGTALDMSAMLWEGIGSNPVDTVWYSVVGMVLQGMAVSAILTKTVEYFDYFTHTDSLFLLLGIAFGASLTVVSLGLNFAEAYKYVHDGADHLDSIFRFIMWSDMSYLLLGTLFNFFAGCYYAWRAWKMARSKWWLIPPFAIGLVAQLVVGVIAVAHGYKLPPVSLATVASLPAFFDKSVKLFKTWGAVTLAVDGCICVCMTVMLVKSKDSMFNNEGKIFRKLLSLVYETMLPPVLCLIILEASSGKKGSPLTDWRRIITSVLPVFYFHSVLSTLCGRASIRKILDSRLQAEGISLITGSTSKTAGSGSGGRVYSTLPPGGKGGGVRGVEEGYELKSEAGSALSFGGVRVQIDQTTSISESEIITPTSKSPFQPSENLSPIQETSVPSLGYQHAGESVNRGWTEDR
ncbi:hypothetical protein IAT38_008401 [Cryptococcus sp. DSM 104549]